MPRAFSKAPPTLAAVIVAWVALAVPGTGAAAADTFTYTGGEQTYAVPAGVTGLHVTLVGAGGASESVPDLSATGGHGAKLMADIPVPTGATTLYVEVGGSGIPADPPSVPYAATGGFNGGGNGPFGGGGASDIRTVPAGQPNSLSSRLAVAGGGGGAGGNVYYSANGGDAGNTDGSGNPGDGSMSGAGATDVAAGQAADQTTATSYCQVADGSDAERGDAGTLGAGGSGAFVFISGNPISGGGGGGLYGGGGGAQCYISPGAVANEISGGGGGGSSGAPGGQNVGIGTDTADPAEVIITAPAPTTTAPPSISGGLTAGDMLAESHATWSSTLALTGYAYQWQRCDASGGSCAVIAGATGQTYTLQTADVGYTLRVRETASNFYGAASATSAAGGVILGLPPATIDPPTITGTATQGQLLVATHAPWSGGLITGYADEWERCDTSGAACQPIPGAVNQAYTLTATDIGSTLRVEETASNRYGVSAPVRSAPTATVQAITTVQAVGTVQAVANSTPVPHLRRTGVRFDRHGVLVRLMCAGSTCRGTIELRHTMTTVALRHGKRHRRKLTVAVGEASYTISPGRSQTIRVPLNRNGRRLLRQLRRLPTKDSITLAQTTGARPTTAITFTVTLTPPGKQGHESRQPARRWRARTTGFAAPEPKAFHRPHMRA